MDDFLVDDPALTIDPQLISPSSPSAAPTTPPPPSRTSVPPSAQSSAPVLPPAVEAYLSSQTQVHALIEAERVIKGWEVLEQYHKGHLETGPASQQLELLHRNDALDVEWAAVFKRIMETEPGDSNEAELIQQLISARRAAFPRHADSNAGNLLPAPDDRITKGWGILHQFFHNRLNSHDALEALKSLNSNDTLDAQWAELWKRIELISIGEGINDEQEIKAVKALLDGHDPVYDSAISSDDELYAWYILTHCLLEWRDPAHARKELDELSVGQKWIGMLDRILATQDKHSEEYAQIRIEVAKMRPIHNSYDEHDHEDYLSHDDDEVRDILDIVDDYTDAQLDWEQKDLLNYFNLTLRQSELWDKYGVYHVRCFVSFYFLQ